MHGVVGRDHTLKRNKRSLAIDQSLIVYLESKRER